MGEFSIPGATIGVVGGGQLGRMMAEAASPLGVRLDVLDPTPHCPAAPVAGRQVVACFDDEQAIRRLADSVDVLTYEIELADPDALERISEETTTRVHPAPETLRMIQDKLEQKRTLKAAGIPVPPFAAVNSVDDLAAAAERFGYPVMLKARRGGYDGHGNLPVEGPEEVASAFAAIDGPAMVEAFVDFTRELSVIGVKGATERDSFEPAENIHEAEILRASIVPARTAQSTRDRARALANDALDELTGRGVYGIELFETPDGEILVNEIAPRPHNSGHWTIEGATVSQFEQHVRAVLGAPIGSTASRGATAMANVLGDVDSPARARPIGVDEILSAGDVNIHWYGKREVRPLRKMAHLTMTDPDRDAAPQLLAAVREQRRKISFRS